MDEKSARILAVDDSNIILITLTRILSKSGFNIDTASAGAAALEKITADPPDLILLDVNMPEMNGFEICHIIKSNPKYKHIYIIMLTAKTSPADEVIGFDTGADDYIPKPFHPDTLLARVRRGLRQVEEKHQATFDTLTRLYNRRVFETFLAQEKEKFLRYQRPFSLILMDLDRFKQVNDTYGHPAGDEVLRHMAKILRQETRGADLPARWGGEELVVLLPETGQSGAQALAEKLRQKVEAHDFPGVGQVTASFGVATMSAADMDLFQDADKAMYRAKQSGRNRVETA